MMTGTRKSFHDMECIPESPCGSPVFYTGVSHLEIPIGFGFGPNSRFSSSQNDLSDNLLTTPIQTLESRVLRLCNKKHTSRDLGDNTADNNVSSNDITTLPERFTKYTSGKRRGSWQGKFRKPFQQVRRLNSEIPETPAPNFNPTFSSTLNLYVSNGDISKLPSYDTTFEDENMKYTNNSKRPSIIIEKSESLDTVNDEGMENEESNHNTPTEDEFSREVDRKQAIRWSKDNLVKLQEEDRKLLMQFIEIRFKIESLGGKRWSRATSLSSYRDLSTLGTLPRSPVDGVPEDIRPEFRQRALSLRTPRLELELSPTLLRHHLMMDDAPLV